MSTKLDSVYPIVSALVKSEDELGPDRKWIPVSEKQEAFLKVFFEEARYDGDKWSECITSICSRDVDKVNKFLKDNGFDIQLAEADIDTINVASILKVMATFTEPGTHTTLKGEDGNHYDAVYKDGGGVVARSDYGDVVTLWCEEGISIHMLKFENPGDDEFSLLDKVREIEGKILGILVEPCEVFFPMIDVDKKVDISFLEGMRTADTVGDVWRINQALQQSIFKMNHKGALAKSAVALQFYATGLPWPKPTLKIDAPFILWIKASVLPLPLFVGWFDYDSWKDPGEIEED